MLSDTTGSPFDVVGGLNITTSDNNPFSASLTIDAPLMAGDVCNVANICSGCTSTNHSDSFSLQGGELNIYGESNVTGKTIQGLVLNGGGNILSGKLDINIGQLNNARCIHGFYFEYNTVKIGKSGESNDNLYFNIATGNTSSNSSIGHQCFAYRGALNQSTDSSGITYIYSGNLNFKAGYGYNWSVGCNARYGFYMYGGVANFASSDAYNRTYGLRTVSTSQCIFIEGGTLNLSNGVSSQGASSDYCGAVVSEYTSVNLGDVYS